MSGSADTSIDFWVLLANGFILYTAVKMNILSMCEWDVGMFFPVLPRALLKYIPRNMETVLIEPCAYFLGYTFSCVLLSLVPAVFLPHDDVNKFKYFPRYSPFTRGTGGYPSESPVTRG